MRAIEITESSFAPGIVAHLTKLGYKKLGRGVDQYAWLEPGTGLVLKIFGSEQGSRPDKLTVSQKTFTKFADYCMANPNNEFLPKFMGWEKFEFKGNYYLQIRCERLFEFRGAGARNWAVQLARMAGFIQDEQTLRYYLNSMNNRNYETPGFDELIISLGEDGLALLWSTLQDLLKIAKKWDFTLDLHPGNFMLGSDGHVVISDPFYNAYQ